MSSEHADVVRDSVACVSAEIVEAEVAAQVGAELGEIAPERVTQRNGYRPRRRDTRAGEISLRISKLRSGGYFPSFVEPRRAEQALGAVLQETYINGVSTRKVDRLLEQLGIASMSKDQVSRLCRGLDEQVRIFRERQLEGRYPYLRLDSKFEKVRERGGVRQKCVVIANAVNESGRREVIGLDVGQAETEAFWREFLGSLRARGLTGVRLCVSDCANVGRCAREAMAELHHLIRRLRDTPDIGRRRVIALSELAHRYASADRSLHVDIAERALDLPQTLAEQAAAIIAEGLANLLGHTCGSAGTVRSSDAGDALLFEVCDDGAANPTEPRFGFGLAGLSARALTIGASPTFEPGEAGDPAVILSWTAAAP
jgi:hypothetical protein